MTRFVDVRHEEWIGASPDLVRAQFADLQHHIEDRVHPRLALRRLPDGPHGLRYEQRVPRLGIPRRDVFERQFRPDGSMVDTSVDGASRGGSMAFRFRDEAALGRHGTLVRIDVHLPLPPLVGLLLKPLIAAQVRREVRESAAQDKADLETGGYRRVAEPWASAA